MAPRRRSTLLALVLVAAGSRPALGQDVVQTPWQRALVAKVSASAAVQAAAAVPALLARLAAPDVREALAHCCPSVAGLSPEDLLQRLREEVAVSEFASAFSVRDSNSTFWVKMSLSDAENVTHLLSPWEVWLRHGLNLTLEPWYSRMDNVETQFYGLQPFEHPAVPRTMDEAHNRGPYVGLNVMRMDGGSPLFGDVAAIFSPRLARSTFLLSPFDTGSWITMCNRSNASRRGGAGHRSLMDDPQPNETYPHNCSAFPGAAGLGTLEHFEHLLLPNEEYWTNASTFIRRLERVFGGAPLRGTDFTTYLEAMPAASVNFPGGVKFFVASFPSLFGTDAGERLRAWCRRMGWALVWSLWLNVDWHGDIMTFWRAGSLPGTYPCDQRVLDPGPLPHIQVNASSLPSDAAHADVHWLSAAAARAAGDVSTEEWAKRWEAFRDALSPGLRLQILSAGSCEDVERCLGVTPSGTCVCYDAVGGPGAAGGDRAAGLTIAV